MFWLRRIITDFAPLRDLMLGVVRDAIGGGFNRGTSREQISLMKFVEVFGSPELAVIFLSN